jgi:RNA polymerase sigma-70 factor, ECF subfamily
MLDTSIWLHKARQFDEETLSEIYDSYSPAIFRYAMRLLGDFNLAEECVAETFSRFLIALYNGGGPKDHLPSYLYRTAHNWIIDCYRSAKPDQFFDAEQTAEIAADPHNQVERNSTLDQIRSAIWQLTPEQRQVLILKYIEELDNAQIAAAIEKPVGAVKALQHRGLKAMRRILGIDGSNGHGRI